MAHAIFGPPDFDHVVGVSLGDVQLTDTDLAADLRIVFPGRQNVAAERIRSTQPLSARLRRAGEGEMNVQVSAEHQFYFEEGESLVPPTMDPTPEERKGV